MDLTLNDILREEITSLNYVLLPPGFRGDQGAVRAVQELLKRVVDELGERSARAQGLTKVITSAEKLNNNPDHTIYLLKDAAANNGAGEVVGLLKVGRKHLFLFDEQDVVRESEPLCLLDFYVVRERCGHGKRLFDYMLQDQKCTPVMLAVDGPSEKMERFLHKNYGIERLIRQNNNFAIAPQYFANGPGVSRPGPASPAPSPFGRYAACKPQSSIGMVIHGNGEQRPHEPVAGPSNGKATPNGGVSRSASPAGAPGPRPRAPLPERPNSLRVPAPPAPPASPAPFAPLRPPRYPRSPPRSPAAPDAPAAGMRYPRRESELSDRMDVKFHHSKLW